jgi:hypothetical protein
VRALALQQPLEAIQRALLRNAAAAPTRRGLDATVNNSRMNS